MAKKSIGQLHATVTADSTQFVNEFQRADNAARRHGAAIREQVNHLVKDVERDFSLKKIGKGFLSGLGIGGGLELARSGMEKLAELFHAPNEQAKELAEYIAEIRKELRELADSRFSLHLGGLAPGEKPAAIDKQRLETERQLAQAQEEYNSATEDMAKAGAASRMTISGTAFDPFQGRYGYGKTMKQIGEEALAKQTEAGKQVEALQTKTAELAEKEIKSIQDANKDLDKAVADFFKPLDDLSEQLTKKRDDLVKSLRTPEEKRVAGAREAWDLFNSGAIDEQTRERMISKAEKEFQNDSKVNMSPWEKAAGSVKVDEMTKRGLGSGANYADITRQNTSILAEIRDILMRATARGFQPTYSD